MALRKVSLKLFGSDRLNEAIKHPSSPRNVLFIVDDFGKGGAAVVVFNLICNLNRSLFTPILCCLDKVGDLGEELNAKGVKVHFLDRQPGTDWGVIAKLRRIIKEESIDLIHAHQYTAYFYGGIAAVLSGRKALIFTEHGRHYPDKCEPKRVLFNKLLLPFTDKVIAVSPAVKQSLITYEKIPAHRIGIIFNGINIQKFKLSQNNAAKKGEFGIPPADLLCGMIARLGSEKDHGTLIKAMPELLKRHPAVSLLLIGDGPQKTELEQLTRELGVMDNVIFTGNRRDIPQLLAILDVAVLSTFYEGTSITLLEAMAAGKPVVASRVGGNPLLVEDGITGFLVPPADPQALADYLAQLLADENLRKKMGQKARQVVEDRFSLNQMLTNYENLYSSVLADS